MKKNKFIRFAVFALLAIGLWTWRYISFNKRIAQVYTTPKLYFRIGDSIDYGNNIINLNAFPDCSLRLDNAELMTAEDYTRKYTLAEKFLNQDNYIEECKIYLMSFQFANNSDIQQKFQLSNMILDGKDRVFYPSHSVYDINSNLNGEYYEVIVQKGETQRFYIPFVLPKSAFTKAEWNGEQEYTMYLVVTQFPLEQSFVV